MEKKKKSKCFKGISINANPQKIRSKIMILFVEFST